MKNNLGALPDNLQSYIYSGGTFSLDSNGDFVADSNGSYGFDNSGNLIQSTGWLADVGNFLLNAGKATADTVSSITNFVSNNPIVTSTSAGKSAYENIISSLLNSIGVSTENTELTNLKTQLQQALTTSQNSSGIFSTANLIKYGLIGAGFLAVIYFINRNNTMLLMSRGRK